jgi:hypothetical protein
MQLPDLATTEVFAKSAKCSAKTVRKNYCLTGHCYGIKPVKVGGRLLWPISEIAKLLNGESLRAESRNHIGKEVAEYQAGGYAEVSHG